MIRLVVAYPASGGTFFDFDYYLKTHLPASVERMQPFGFVGWEVMRGESTVAGAPPPSLCVTHLDFNSLEQMQAGMQAHGAELRADWPNYTDIDPVVTVVTLLDAQVLE